MKKLASKLLRLAYENPDLRQEIGSLLLKHGNPSPRTLEKIAHHA